MKFTTEAEPFLRMVEMLGEPKLGRKRGHAIVSLGASQGKVWVEQEDKVAQTEAVVWEEGGCTVSEARLLSALRLYRGETGLTLEAHGQTLRIGEVSMPIFGYRATAEPPAQCQIFLTTDIGVVPSKSTARLELAEMV